MMPHLGVLSTVNEEAGTQVFEKDCIIFLGTCVAPKGELNPKKPVLRVQMLLPSGERVDKTFGFQELELWEATRDDEVQATFSPLQKTLDIGAGPGKPLSTTIRGGVVGIVVDTRGRPDIELPTDPAQRVPMLEGWVDVMNEYPRGDA